MSVFSKTSEDEIKKRQMEQDARQRDLERLAADLERRVANVATDEQRINEQWAALAAERAKAKKDLLEANQALMQREADAKNGFVAQQQEAFRETIYVRSLELDARLREIAELKERIAESFESLAKEKATLAACELAIKEREQQADAGFPDRLKSILAALETRETGCVERERGLDARDAEARAQHKALQDQAEALRRREEQVALAEQERDAGFAESRRALDLDLRARRQELADRAEELRLREEEIARAEVDRDRGFTEMRRKVDGELLARRQAVEAELGQLRLDRLADVQREIDGERQRRREDVQRELDAERATAGAQIDARREQFDAERGRVEAALRAGTEEVNRREAIAAAKEQELDRRKELLDAHEKAIEERRRAIDVEVEQKLEHRKRALDAVEADLAERAEAQEAEVEKAGAERRLSFEKREESLKVEMNRLRGQIQSADRMQGTFETLKRQLGGRDAEEVLADLAAKENELRELRERVADASPAMRGELDRLRAERDRFQALVDERTAELESLQARMRGEDAVRLKLQEEQVRTKSLETRLGALEGQCNYLAEENKRLRSAYERDADRLARIRDIEASESGVAREVDRMPPNQAVDEIQWLERIAKSCIDYGLRFHPRILYAFHTALKTAEWSPITVLAGVSGTGKSELPRLYSHFGGIVFKSLPVQPNWDSQESMLGFFNSIDNKFDAQPVLRLLARSQRAWEADNGLRDHLIMVLLDEMNLAHPELYFAEFLSKLELRRGCKGNVPELEIKLGAGPLPYLLPMGRNVLWTGTMNQDETTKSLSDKVLDRSIVIHFPRPASLERRRELKPLPQAAPLLPRRAWESWWTRKSEFSDEEIRPFKRILEGVNDSLASVGRALGHRVWQSVEYYMANYPDTLAAQRSQNRDALGKAMRTAFEDQLAQKVMPKLRGIDTRGRGKTNCLDQIRGLLVDNGYDDLVEDFNVSCECGYGQFIWQTVNFLRETTAIEPVAPEIASASTRGEVPAAPAPAVVDAAPVAPAAPAPPKVSPPPESAEDIPPARFMPNAPARIQRWKELNPAKRRKYLDDVGEKAE